MSLVTSFLVMLQPLAWAMTAPTFSNLATLLAGWAFASRRTVTGMLLAARAVGKKHHSAFHRLFAQAQWSLDRIGLLVFDMITPWLNDGEVLLALDDTLARKRGLKVFGAGMHHDPLLSTRNKAVMNWGHS
jgi:SRSO17 transposase